MSNDFLGIGLQFSCTDARNSGSIITGGMQADALCIHDSRLRTIYYLKSSKVSDQSDALKMLASRCVLCMKCVK